MVTKRNARLSASDTLLASLVGDAEYALGRVESDDRPVHRREAMRSIIAAIEGLAWIYREHVRVVASDMVELGPLLNLAFDEKSYTITEGGELVEQIKFLPLTAMFRLTTRVAMEINDAIYVDFGQQGWSRLGKAIGKRNELAHPKSVSALTVTDEDLRNARSGLFWVFKTVLSVMDKTVQAARVYSEDLRGVADALISGDEHALADYRRVMAESDGPLVITGLKKRASGPKR